MRRLRRIIRIRRILQTRASVVSETPIRRISGVPAYLNLSELSGKLRYPTDVD